jgi:hypothetical protein
MSPRFAITEANEQYEMLKEYKAIREREISGMVAPYIRLTDRYGSLIAGLTFILGRIKPANTQDVVIRDLMADVFDFLYEAVRMSAPLEIKTPPLAANCLVCGIPLVGLTAVFLRWRCIRRSPRNPNC